MDIICPPGRRIPHAATVTENGEQAGAAWLSTPPPATIIGVSARQVDGGLKAATHRPRRTSSFSRYSLKLRQPNRPRQPDRDNLSDLLKREKGDFCDARRSDFRSARWVKRNSNGCWTR